MSIQDETQKSENQVQMHPLDGIVVVEIADNLVAYCGRFLASLGADVILVEPPGGCAHRRGLADQVGETLAPSFACLHTGKSSVVLDPGNNDDIAALRQLIAKADVLLQGTGIEWGNQLNLSSDILQKENPGLVLASILPFGSHGPYKDYRSSVSVDFAMSGLMSLSGNPGEPPVLAPGDQSAVVAGAQASVGILVALRAREFDGLGQEVEVSVQEAFSAQENIVSSYTGDNWRGERTGSQHRVAAPGRIFPCKDGFVHLFVSPVQKGAWERLVDWMGPAAGALSQEVWSNPRFRRTHIEELNEVIRAWTTTWFKEDFYIEAQKRHIPCAPVNSMSNFIQDPQIIARDFFKSVPGYEEPSYLYPGPVVIVNGSRRTDERRAPKLGADNAVHAFDKNAVGN